MRFKINKSTKMYMMFFFLALRRGVEASSLRFFMDGSRVREDDTPLSRQMEDRAVLEYVLEPDDDDDDDDDDEGELALNEKRVSLLGLTRIHGGSLQIRSFMREMVDREKTTFRSLVGSIGGFFSSLAVKQPARLSGLLDVSFCANAGSQHCTYCSQICNSFPCGLVLALNQAERSRTICLSAGKVIALVRQRPDSHLVESLLDEYDALNATTDDEADP